ncbi:hypothetical protein I2I11_14260 [Pontibacter sp. 172403-2]|uniref:hypothetical protein n=1 Tax=Pontibacter rufus TaxID=2791028 RepID=UPI0018AFAF01|nr:hypothetical protein [Pontibacter sp. 172403-2]MBF9254464.1 hypothetical protein [Pontibacter sp. 172403-2]
MKTRNQLEHGYPKLLRIEPENENNQPHHFFQERLHSGSGLHRNPVVIHPSGAQQPHTVHSTGSVTPMPSNPKQYSTHSGYVTYNSGYERRSTYTSYPVYPGRKSTNAKSSTSSTSNIYLGGRTSSYGPSGCAAVQKQYSYGRYNASDKTSDDTPGVNEAK